MFPFHFLFSITVFSCIKVTFWKKNSIKYNYYLQHFPVKGVLWVSFNFRDIPLVLENFHPPRLHFGEDGRSKHCFVLISFRKGPRHLVWSEPAILRVEISITLLWQTQHMRLLKEVYTIFERFLPHLAVSSIISLVLETIFTQWKHICCRIWAIRTWLNCNLLTLAANKKISSSVKEEFTTPGKGCTPSVMKTLDSNQNWLWTPEGEVETSSRGVGNEAEIRGLRQRNSTGDGESLTSVKVMFVLTVCRFKAHLSVHV